MRHNLLLNSALLFLTLMVFSTGLQAAQVTINFDETDLINVGDEIKWQYSPLDREDPLTYQFGHVDFSSDFDGDNSAGVIVTAGVDGSQALQSTAAFDVDGELGLYIYFYLPVYSVEISVYEYGTSRPDESVYMGIYDYWDDDGSYMDGEYLGQKDESHNEEGKPPPWRTLAYSSSTSIDIVKLWRSQNSTGFKIDNVTFSDVPTVPEPEMWIMLLPALGIVGFSAYRRRQEAQVSILNS